MEIAVVGIGFAISIVQTVLFRRMGAATALTCIAHVTQAYADLPVVDKNQPLDDAACRKIQSFLCLLQVVGDRLPVKWWVTMAEHITLLCDIAPDTALATKVRHQMNKKRPILARIRSRLPSQRSRQRHGQANHMVSSICCAACPAQPSLAATTTHTPTAITIACQSPILPCHITPSTPETASSLEYSVSPMTLTTSTLESFVSSRSRLSFYDDDEDASSPASDISSTSMASTSSSSNLKFTASKSRASMHTHCFNQETSAEAANRAPSRACVPCPLHTCGVVGPGLVEIQVGASCGSTANA